MSSDGANIQRRTLTTIVRDKPGVLARLASMFRRRGFNIVSLAVGPSEQAGLSRITFVVEGHSAVVAKTAHQVEKLVDVVKVLDVTELNHVWRELALIKVNAPTENRQEILDLGNVFRAKVVDIGVSTITFEVTGGRSKIDSFVELVRKFGVCDVMRTGRVAVLRDALNVDSKPGDFVETYSPIKLQHVSKNHSGSV